MTLGFHLSAKRPLLKCHMACIFMSCVTLSFIRLSQNTCNSNLLGIRRNSTMYLDFARRTQWYDPRCHPRSREIHRFATRVYHFTLSEVSRNCLLLLLSTVSLFLHCANEKPLHLQDHFWSFLFTRLRLCLAFTFN